MWSLVNSLRISISEKMSESVLTASYRNTSISDAERQSIINAAVAAVDSSKPRYKDVSVSFNFGSDTSSPTHTSHGMKTIQTATAIAATNLSYKHTPGGGSSSNHVLHESGFEIPIATSPAAFMELPFYGYTVSIHYTSTYIVITPNIGSYGRQGAWGTLVCRFYGTY